VKKNIALLAAVLAVLTLLPAVSASREELKVIMTTDAVHYNAGDEVTLTIHVLCGFEYVDPDELDVIVDCYQAPDRSIETTKEDTGIYTASFVIEDNDIGWDGEVSVDAEVEYQGHWDCHGVYFRAYHLEVSTTIDTSWPEKGDTVELRAIVTNNSRNYDPESVLVVVYVDRVGDNYQHYEMLETTRVSEGVYTASYPIDPQDNESHSYEFETWVDDGGVSATYFPLEVELKHYLVWCYDGAGSRDGSTADFNVHVVDREGKAVQGATIWLQYSLIDESGWSKGRGVVNGTTNNHGTSSFSIDYTGGEFIGVEGWANASHHQRFEGVVDPEGNYVSVEGDDYIGWGFEVMHENDKHFHEEEKETRFDFRAYMDTKEYEGEYVDVYAYTRLGTLHKERVQVADDDTFSVTLTTPRVPEGEKHIRLRFFFRADESNSYRSSSESVSVTKEPLFELDAPFELEALEPGKVSRITAEGKGLEGYLNYALCVPYDGQKKEVTAENYAELTKKVDESWKCWTGGYYLPADQCPLVADGDGEFTGELYCLPGWEDVERFLVLVVFYRYDFGEDIGFVHAGALILGQGEEGSFRGEDDDDEGSFEIAGMNGWAVMGLLLAVLVAGFIAVKRDLLPSGIFGMPGAGDEEREEEYEGLGDETDEDEAEEKVYATVSRIFCPSCQESLRLIPEYRCYWCDNCWHYVTPASSPGGQPLVVRPSMPQEQTGQESPENDEDFAIPLDD